MLKSKENYSEKKKQAIVQGCSKHIKKGLENKKNGQ